MGHPAHPGDVVCPWRLFVCFECQRAFSLRSELRRLPMGARPWGCSIPIEGRRPSVELKGLEKQGSGELFMARSLALKRLIVMGWYGFDSGNEQATGGSGGAHGSGRSSGTGSLWSGCDLVSLVGVRLCLKNSKLTITKMPLFNNYYSVLNE
jgi:hypothetical protein